MGPNVSQGWGVGDIETVESGGTRERLGGMVLRDIV